MTSDSHIPPALTERIATEVAERLALQGKLMWSVEEVAFATGLCTRTVWRWVATDDFPQPRGRGGRTMWLADDVRAWAKALPRCSPKRRGA